MNRPSLRCGLAAMTMLLIPCLFPLVSNAQPSNAERYSSVSAFQKRWAAAKSQTEQRITVGQTRKAIIIDGNINTGEWEDATVIAGLANSRTLDGALHQTHVWITYDNRFLYIAMRSQMPVLEKKVPNDLLGEVLLRTRAIADDTNVDFDDALGLDFVPRYPDGNLYKIYANAIGTKYDYLFYNSGTHAVDIKWDPQWISKSRVDNKQWNLEVAIPVDAFGTASIADGEVWGMSVERIWRMLRSGADRWSIGGAPAKDPQLPWRHGPMGQVRFVGAENIVVKNQGVAGLLSGKPAARLLLRNRKQISQKLTARLSFSRNILAEKEVVLAAGATQSINLNADLTQALAGLVSLAVNDEVGNVLYQEQWLYKPQDGLNIDLKSYPTSNLMQAAWELRLPQDQLKEYSLELSLQDTEKVRPAIVQRLRRLKTLKGNADFKTGSLPEGRYLLTAVLKKGGATFATRQSEYSRQPLPHWIGNSYGISEVPPAPWTPIQEASDRVDIWNRQVQYDGRLFPAQIINQQSPMLARPIELNVQMRGKQKLSSSGDKSNVSVQWVQKNPSRVTSKRVQSVGGVQLTSTSYVEFDGMTWIELEVAAQDKAGLLQNLSFNIPLNKQWGDLINTYDYTLRNSGKLPEKGWSGRMRPLWVGNGDGGVQFFAETDATWRGSKQMSVQRVGDEVQLQANFIDTPTAIDKPLKFAFGFITTPVKPAPRNHRDWRVISGSSRANDVRSDYLKSVAGRNKNLQVFDIWNQGWWWLPKKDNTNPDWTGFLPVPGDTALPSYLDQTADGYEVRRSLYGRLSQIGTNNPWFRQFGHEWASDAHRIYNIAPTADSVLEQTEVSTNSASYRDFVAWGYHQLLTKHRVPGLYFDLSHVVEDNNAHHGGGQDLGYGGVIPTQSILGQREMFKRIYTLLKQHDPQAMIFHHMSGHVMMPVESFVDGLVDGENTYPLLDREKNPGYEKILTIDQFRAEYAGQNNFGPVGVVLDQFGRRGSIVGDEWKTMRHHGEYLVGMTLLHDSTNWWSYMPTAIYADMYTAMDDAGVDSSYVYLPYWRQTALKLPDGVVASFYVSPEHDKAAMVLLNASDKDLSVDLNVNGDKLGLTGDKPTLKVLYPPAAMENGVKDLNLNLAAYTVQIIEIGTRSQ